MVVMLGMAPFIGISGHVKTIRSLIIFFNFFSNHLVSSHKATLGLERALNVFITNFYPYFDFLVIQNSPIYTNAMNLSCLQVSAMNLEGQNGQKLDSRVFDSLAMQVVTSPIVVVLCPDESQLSNHLTQVSEFYKVRRQATSLVYFFVVWPDGTPSRQADIEGILRSSLPHNPLDSQFYIVTQNGELWEFYHVLGVAVFQQALTTSETILAPRILRRQNFHGATVTAFVMSDYFRPHMIEMDVVNGTVHVTRGVVIDMFTMFSQSLNFSVKYIKGIDWIGQGPNGSLTGLGKQLEDNGGDIILAPSELLMYRLQLLSYSHPIIGLQLQAYFKKPHPSIYRNVLIEAFTPKLWGVFVANAAVIYLALVLFKFLKNRWEQSYIPEDEEVAGYMNAFFLTLATICQQGWHTAPSSLSLRIIVLAALVSGLLYYTAFAASIVSIFSVDLNRLRTIDNLLDHGFTLYGNLYSLTGQEIVKAQAKKQGVPFADRRLEFPEALDKLRKSRSALISMRPIFDQMIHPTEDSQKDDLCQWLAEIPLPNTAHRLGFFFRKLDPLKKFIDAELTRWDQRGLLSHNRREYLKSSESRCGILAKTSKELIFWDVRGAYAVLGIGVIASVTILAVEMMWCRSRNEFEHKYGCTKESSTSTVG